MFGVVAGGKGRQPIAQVIDEADRETVGQVRINDGPMFPEKELGWQLYEGQEGRGYATEAAVALRDWALRALCLDGLVSYVHPEDLASAAIAERLGAALDPNALKPNPDALVSCRSRGDVSWYPP